MPSSLPHRLVLVGGGHAMLPSLRYARSWVDGGVEVTLVDPHRWLYYSGMVPEYLGGVYGEGDVRIDLADLAHRAGVRFVHSAAVHLDPDAQVVRTDDGTELGFDVLALDVGGVNPAVPEAAVATKPITRLRALAPHLEATLADSAASLRLAIAGGGAAGVEVALNVTGRFAGAGRLGDLDLTLVEQDDRLLPGFPNGMRRHVAGLLQRRGATVQTSTSVDAIVQASDGVRFHASGCDQLADVLLWATGVVGPDVLRSSGLPTDARGFLHVDRTLRTAHPRVFAAGDGATVEGTSLAKVGVHAVKQGATLRANLDRTLQRLAERGCVPAASGLSRFRPYPIAPLILSTGDRAGLWTAGPLWAAHPWLLRLKHWIDRRWIQAYAPERWGDASWRDLLGVEAAAHKRHRHNGSTYHSTAR